jgi:hypothetical protein
MHETVMEYKISTANYNAIYSTKKMRYKQVKRYIAWLERKMPLKGSMIEIIYEATGEIYASRTESGVWEIYVEP